MRTKEREIKSLISPSLIFPLLGTAFTYFFSGEFLYLTSSITSTGRLLPATKLFYDLPY